MNSGFIGTVGGKAIRGFTLLELLVAMVLLGLLCTLAYPSCNEWGKNLIFRKAAREVVMVFREARSRAISSNKEHRIEFDPATNKYRVMQGNRAYNSSEWDVTIRDWTAFPVEVTYSVNVPGNKIQVNTNGTANGGTITIKDITSDPKYSVVINRTGRIRIT